MPEEVYTLGVFHLDVRERRLTRDGQVVPLKGKAFDLLVALAERPDSLVTHAELLDRVWPDTVVEPNNVAHNVSILRKALGDDGGVAIETVPRRGYRLAGASASRRQDGTPEQEVGFCRAIDGARLAYARVGAGTPLVKVANWLSHLELDWGSPIWNHWLSFMSESRSLIRYDARGNGMSEWRVDDIDFEHFVSDLLSVMDAAGVERAPLLGISQGAAVAAAFAARHPQRVSGLVLIGGCARGWRTKNNARLDEQFDALMTLMHAGWGQENPLFRQIFTTAFFPEATQAQMAYFNELQRKTTTPDNAVRLLSALGDLDIREELERIDAPTLVLHSRTDAVVPLRDGMELAAGIAGARFVSLESVNHLLLEGEPAWERFRSEVSRFLGDLETDRAG